MEDLFFHLRERANSITFLKSLIKNNQEEFFSALTSERNKEKTRLIVEVEIINCLYTFKKFRMADLNFFQ